MIILLEYRLQYLGAEGAGHRNNMKQSKRRNFLEVTLQQAIRQAESKAFKDPQVKTMMMKLRKLYQEDSGDFMVALGLSGPPPTQKNHSALPQSRIPHLIFLLDSLAKRSIPLPPRKQDGILPPPISENFAVPFSPIKNPNNPGNDEVALRERRTIIRRIELEMVSLESTYKDIKADEPMILQRRGKYSVPAERLKAERLLRELPGKIKFLAQKKSELNNL